MSKYKHQLMTIKLFAKGILILLVVALIGCNSNEDPENSTLDVVSLSFVQEAIKNASENNFEKENLPVWLSEYLHNLKPDNIRDVAAFQTKWKGEYIYYVYDEYSSCLLCATYKFDGSKFNSNNNFVDFWNSEPEWEIIYLRKSIIHDL